MSTPPFLRVEVLCDRVPRLGEDSLVAVSRRLSVAYNRGLNVIPKIFHRIWVGGRPMPAELMGYEQSWMRHHPEWTICLWTDRSMPPLSNQELYEEATEPAQKADIARFDLLFRFGGVYIDCDFECLRSIDRLLRGVDCFSASAGDCYVATGIMGCVPAHPYFAELVGALRGSIDRYRHRPINEQSGPVFLTRMSAWSEMTVFPKEFFYPYYWGEEHRRDEPFPEAYAVHHWASSWFR
jgi:mannosyltransferase OCH1-like enzyme